MSTLLLTFDPTATKCYNLFQASHIFSIKLQLYSVFLNFYKNHSHPSKHIQTFPVTGATMTKMCQVRILLLLTVAALAQGAVPLKIAIGDMFMTFKQYMLRYTNDTTIKRNGLIDKRYRWPGGIVPVIIAPQFSANDVTTIKAAAAEISRGTCVKFQFDVNPRSHPIHVKINKIGSGLCSADIGYVKQATKINLDPVRCKKGSIIHEMLHVLGFYHMQEAAERDNYININFNNIDPKRKDQFKKSNQVSLFNTPYDISVKI